ncbi:MAG TPA: hypothetical protein VHM26_02930 [Chitinophagaceae bacterium]|nr:hypothetical protein [Chitinophagaceae bacterium]
MKFPLLAAFLWAHLFLCAQESHLQILKNGKVNKRIPEGSTIIVMDDSGYKYIGPYSIINDSNLAIAGAIISINKIEEFRFPRQPKKPFDWKTFGYITAGVILSTAGMILSKWEKPKDAIINSATLGYSQYVIRAAKKLIFKKKRKFKMGKKRRLRIWSLSPYHQQQRKAF